MGGRHCGNGYAVQGNLLAGARTVEAMAARYEALEGKPFAYRLVQALLAGDEAGGDRRGRQAAAVVLRQSGGGYGGDNDILIDLRVDDHPDPVLRKEPVAISHPGVGDHGQPHAEKLPELGG